MGFLTVDYHLRNLIEESIERLRENPDLIDDIFYELTVGTMARKLGRRTIDSIKDFFVKNDIPVRSSYNANTAEIPSITVHLVSSLESQQYKAFQDHITYTKESTVATKLSELFSAESYDVETGIVSVNKNTDPRYLIPGQPIFSVRDNKTYYITSPIIVNKEDTPPVAKTSQTFRIVEKTGTSPEIVNLSELIIMSKLDYKAYRSAGAIFDETFELRCFGASNTDQSIWLYYLVMYVLFRNKGYFEQVGIHNQSVSTGEFIRDLAKAPNNIWGRFIRFRCLVQHTWLEDLPEVVDESWATVTPMSPQVPNMVSSITTEQETQAYRDANSELIVMYDNTKGEFYTEDGHRRGTFLSSTNNDLDLVPFDSFITGEGYEDE